jgi:hypothetical protein
MNSKTAVPALVLLMMGTLSSEPLQAYNELIHVRFTNAAFDRSVLADLSVGPLQSLDVKDVSTPAFFTIPSEGMESEFASVRDLVAWGAYYEDNPLFEGRFLRHFLDPQQANRGFKGEFASSPEWVLETQANSSQLFSLRDAQQLHLDALTSSSRSARERNSVLLLQSVGRAVHHLQDMAQPAHVRDDGHPWPVGDNYYETYTDTQFADPLKRELSERSCGQSALDLRDFDEAQKFWLNDSRGIAEFVSTQFVSQDTNFRWVGSGWVNQSRHPKPAFPEQPQFESTSLRELGIQHPIPDLPISFLGLQISDEISGEGCTNQRASSRSFLADNFAGVTPWRGYSLNHFNFEAGYPILFPRAIEYSAGLINYIFRGRLKLESFAETASSVEITIRNDSAAEFAMFGHPENGVEEFSLYYDAQDGLRKRIALSNGEIASARVEYGNARTFSVPLPADLDRSKQRPFILVFNGMVGKERGIAALAIGKQDSTFIVTPNYSVTDGNDGPRAIEDVRGTWQANSRAGNRAGNVDWRGHGPDDVLTWDGPSSRFFGVTSSSRNIYQGGKVLTTAPAPVIGAAIYRIESGRYLLAAVNEDGRFKIYRRPYQLSYHKHGMWDPLNNPFGWVLLHAGPVSPRSPMFFNASGTEAQVFADATTRYKVTIDGSKASSVAISNIGTITRAHTQTRERTVSVETNPGPPNACNANGTTCLSRGECDGNPNACLVSQSTQDISNRYAVNSATRHDNVASTVVCADYKGDQEVLCRVEADETPSIGSLTSVGHFTQSKITTQTTCSTAVLSGETDYDHDLRRVDDVREVMVLKVGSKTIPLSGTAIRADANFRSEVHRLFGMNTPPTVDFTVDETVTSYDTKILYVDARNDIVIYEDHQRIERDTGGGTAQATPGNYPNEYWFEAPVRTEVRTTSRLIASAREDHVLSSAAVDEQTSQGTRHENTGFNTIEPNHCRSEPAVTETDERTKEYPLQDFYRNALHPKLNDVTQSLSAISNAKLVASWPRWVRQNDNSYLQEGTWNYLSSGDLATLLPGATSTAKYAPTGLVR